MLTTYDTFEVRASTAIPPISIDTEKRTIYGYAVVWGAVSTITADGFRHVYNRGSLTYRPRIVGLWSHSLASPLAATDNGSLRYSEDDIGVKVEMDLLPTTIGNDAWEMVRAKLVRGMSFGAMIRAKAKTKDATVLEITAAEVVEYTVTISPAMVETSISTSPENVSQQMQGQKRKSAKYELEKARLAMRRPPGRVPG